MKIIEHLERAKNPLFSYEIVPPPRGRSVKDIVDIAETLLPLNPPWIDVTSHASTAYFHENPDGTVRRKTVRKRPGTMGICGVIQNRFKIDTVAHVLCQGFTREETEDALIELSFLGIHNVLALRGDAPNYEKQIDKNRSANTYASDLVTQLKDLRSGKFVEDISDSAPLDFCIGVAGYPEKHFEAANFKTDIKHLKTKVDAGADYITTQMFFDNDNYFKYVKMCREAGIKVPIIPGVKILRTTGQLKSIPKTFHIDLPDELVDEVHESPNHVAEIGMRWAKKQTQGLLEAGVPCVHFYIMNDTPAVVDVVKHFQKV